MRLPIDAVPRVHSSATIKDILVKLDDFGCGTALVLGGDNELKGVVSDGDIRRSLIKGGELNHTTARDIMNLSPQVVHETASHAKTQRVFDQQGYDLLPVVSFGKVVGVITRESCAQHTNDNFFVIPAGGEGRRMGHLTQKTPKPLLEIHGQTIIDYILRNARRQRMSNIVLTVCKFPEQFTRFHGPDLITLTEDNPRGPAGQLFDLAERTDDPIIVHHGDVVCNADYGEFLTLPKGVDILLGTTEVSFNFPYGVVHSDDERRLKRVEEKPTLKTDVFAGIYAVNPRALRETKHNLGFATNILSLTTVLHTRTVKISANWRDVGSPNELTRAREDADVGRLT